ncbi:MAG: GNAT family N-acetyltransferase [Microthrixaceae bacterium]|nr:GNAT family N-acetyltransferase [Microthrixaceae bacterium]
MPLQGALRARGRGSFPRVHPRRTPARALLRGFGAACGDFGVVALDGEVPVGACWVRVFPRDAPGYGWVDDDVPELTVAVTDPARGRGLGTTLIEMVLDHAAARGVLRVSLSVDPRSPAVRLYERLGFEPVGRSGTSITMERATSGC